MEACPLAAARVQSSAAADGTFALPTAACSGLARAYSVEDAPAAVYQRPWSRWPASQAAAEAASESRCVPRPMGVVTLHAARSLQRWMVVPRSGHER